MRLVSFHLALVGLFSFSQVGLAADTRVAIVFDKGGKDDKSFNAAAHAGAQMAKGKLGIQLKFVEATDDNSFEPMLKAFARKDFDLIIAVGFAQAEALKKVAPQFPNKKFAIIDSIVEGANVRSLMFEEHEGSFLVGAAAALASKSGAVGFIGGMDIPLIRRFEMGYKAGAQKVNPRIKVVSNFVGVTGDSWNNPAKAKELALAQYNTGVDVIFAAAGASGAGLFDAAEEKKKFAIGVDSNQNWIKPGRVLTSMTKRADLAVFVSIEDVKNGRFDGGVKRYGLHNQGVEAVIDQHNQALITPEMRKKLDQFKAEIISGKIVVPDAYKKK